MSENAKVTYTSGPIHFAVAGEPVPKQSYRAVKGGGYTDPRVKAWQEHVTIRARETMRGEQPISGYVSVRLVFVLGNKRRVDCDNLSKGVLDGMRGIVFGDDSQVVNLHIVKRVDKDQTGVAIHVYPGGDLPQYFERTNQRG